MGQAGNRGGSEDHAVRRKPTEGLAFEDLLKELRSYLAEVAGQGDTTRYLRQIYSAQARVQRAPGGGASPERRRPAGAADEPAETRDDIQRAQTVVNKLLPAKPPSVPGLDIAFFNRSCHEVGGDYFDFITLPQDRIGLVIADVAGKGFGASIVMAMLREILHIVSSNEETPAKAVSSANRLLMPDMPRGMFVTMIYGVVDPAARELTLVNAGHCAPIIWRPRLTGARVLDLRGPALGVLDPARFAQGVAQRTLALEPGDCMCFFTDGVSEAKDLLGEEFGEQRLAQVLRDHAGESADQIVAAVTKSVDDHTKGAAQHDDITLIVVRALPKSAGEGEREAASDE